MVLGRILGVLYSLNQHVWISLIVSRRQRYFEHDKQCQGGLFFLMNAEQSGKDVPQRIDTGRRVTINKETISLFGSINFGGFEEATVL